MGCTDELKPMRNVPTAAVTHRNRETVRSLAPDDQ